MKIELRLIPKPSIKIVLLVLVLYSFTSCKPDTKTVEKEENSKIVFERWSEHPFIPRTPNTFFSILVANPEVITYKDNMYFFYRGQDEKGYDEIGLWTNPAATADGIQWKNQLADPILPVSTSDNAPDNLHILDPGAIVKGDSLLIFYTGKSKFTNPNNSICLAITTDGKTFTKAAINPIIKGASAPEILYHNGLYHLFYQRDNSNGAYWDLFKVTSSDGIHFDSSQEQKVFSPSKEAGTFDAGSFTTARIFKDGDYFYMTYAACTQFIDYPESVGLARSKNLVDWERYPHNPIFKRNNPGTWDEAALWYPTVHKINGEYMMYYEGSGADLGTITNQAKEASTLAREENYGGYRVTNFSQMGIATYKGSLENWD